MKNIEKGKTGDMKTMTMESGKSCFINLSNHPSSDWKKEQVLAAQEYGEIIDMPFPGISANASEGDIADLAEQYAKEIADKNPAAVMCQGEFTFVYALVRRLNALGIVCVAACSERQTTEYTDENGKLKRESVFEFVRFREYN